MCRPCAAAILAFAAVPLAAQGLASGPPKGRPLTALNVVAPAAGAASFDAAAPLRHGPGAILFVHEITRNVAPMLRGFDEACAARTALGLHSALVLLSDDRTGSEQRAPQVARSLRLQQPLLLSVDGAEGPGNYALNRKASLTLVLSRDGKVVESLAFTDTGAVDLDLLDLALHGIAGSLPAEPGAVQQALQQQLPAERQALVDIIAALERQRRALQEQLQADVRPRAAAPMQRQRAEPEPAAAAAATPRPAAHPPSPVPDAELAALVRVLVRKDIDADTLEGTFAKIDTRLAAAPELRPALQQCLRDILAQDGYGAATARARMQRWLQPAGGGR